MYILRKRLYQLLGLQAETEDQEVVTRSSEGPGEYDTWGLLQGRADNFLQLNSVFHSPAKKKIILSHVPEIDEFYIAFFNALLGDENLELHIWTANGLTQITSLRQLAEVLELIQETTVEKMRDVLLHEQVISSQGGVFLDACYYAGIKQAEIVRSVDFWFDSLKDEQPAPLLPEVTQLDIKLDSIPAYNRAALLYPQRITSLNFVDIPDYLHTQAISQFPNAQKLIYHTRITPGAHLKGKSIELVRSEISQTKMRDIILLLSKYEVKEFVLKYFCLVDGAGIKFDINVPPSSMQSLSLMSEENSYWIDLSALIKLESLELDMSIAHLIFPRTSSMLLRHLKLQDILPSLDLRELNVLETLTLVSAEPAQVIWPTKPCFTDLTLSVLLWESVPPTHHAQLEKLSIICNAENKEPFNLAHCRKLKNLSIEATGGQEKLDFSKASWPAKNAITTLELYGDNQAEVLDLSSFENLEKIKLKNFSNLKQIKWPKTKDKIKGMSIINCGKLEALDLCDCSSLEKVLVEEVKCNMIFNSSTSIERLILDSIESLVDLSPAGNIKTLICRGIPDEKIKFNSSLREIRSGGTKIIKLSTLLAILSTCPYLEAVELYDFSSQWLIELYRKPDKTTEKIKIIGRFREIAAAFLQIKKITELHLERFKAPNGILDLSSFSHIGHLNLDCCIVEKIIFAPGVIIDNITFKEYQTSHLDLSLINGLQCLKIIGPLKSIEMPRDNLLRSLSLQEIDTRIFPPFKQFTRLEKISIKNCEIETINLQGLNNLFAIDIHGADAFTIDVRDCQNLQSVSVRAQREEPSDPCKSVLLHGLADCQKLEVLSLQCSNIKEIQDGGLPAKCFLDDPHRLLRSIPLSFSKSDQAIKRLDAANKRHPVSLFNFGDEFRTCHDAGETKPSASSGSFKANVYSQHRPPKTVYRINYLGRCTWDENKKTGKREIKFVTGDITREPVPFKSIPLTLDQIKQQVDKNSLLEAGGMEGEFQPGKFYPLINSAAVIRCDRDISQHLGCSKPDAIEIFWENEAQRYCFRLKAGEPPQRLNLHYYFTLDQNYAFESSPRKYAASVKAVDAELQHALKERLQNEEKLAFLFSDRDTVEKIRELKRYCKEFKPVHTDDVFSTDLDTMVHHIIYQQGRCDERSHAFMLLASLIDVKVALISNEDHRFCELADESNQLQSCQLGGAEHLNITSLTDRGEDIFQPGLSKKAAAQAGTKTESAPASQSGSKKKAIPTEEKVPETKKQWFSKEIKKASSIKPIHSFAELQRIDRHTSPLVLLNKTGNHNHAEELKTIDQLLLQAADHGFQKTLVISRLEDFAMYFKPPTLLDGVHDHAPSGPLRQMIHGNQKSLLIINWSMIPAEKIASYQSLLETPARFSNEKVTNPNLRIIGIKSVAAHKLQDTAFLSRCQPVRLESSFFSKQAPDVKQEEKAQEITVDLNYQPYWHDALWGKCDGHSIQESEFIKALRQIHAHAGIRLIIKNKPKNAYDLDMFLLRLAREKQFLLNGEIIKVNVPVSVQVIEEKPLPKPGNVHLHTSEEPGPRQRIYLNLNNLYECRHQFIYGADRTMTEQAGHLTRYNAKEQVFYLTQSISFNEWQALIKYIAAHFPPDQQFHFRLAPGVEIEKLSFSPVMAVVQKTPPHEFKMPDANNPLVISNEPELIVVQLKKQYTDALVHETILRDKPSDLLAKVTSEGKIYTYQKQKVLQALEEGRTVILNGPMSPALYQALLPLLKNPPRLFNNGRYIPEPGQPWGQLFVVMPPPAADFSFVANVTRCDYQLADYQEMLTQEGAPDKDPHIVKIFQFLRDAARVPCLQGELPSYELIDWMRERLKTPKLHPQNPVKGKTTYRYKKGSEAYAYINALGKYYFAEQDETAPRLEKIQHIKARYNIQNVAEFRLHVWKILNCFHGKELHALLGDSLDKVVTMESGHPVLRESVLQKLYYEHFQPIVDLDPVPAVLKKPNKRETQLKILLHDEKTRLIIHRGPPGTSKTYVVRYGLKGCFEEKDMIKWLSAKPGPGKEVLAMLWDEANMRTPGTFDWAKGFLRGDRKVVYQGVEYELSPQHKIIATMNEDSDEGRFAHTLFQRGEEIYFSKPTSDLLEKVILNAFLPEGLNKPDYKKHLLDAYVSLEKRFPDMVLSYRNMQNLVDRFVKLCERGPEGQERDAAFYQAALYSACSVEFAGSIKDLTQRKGYLAHLQKAILGAEKPPVPLKLEVLSTEQSIPTEKLYLVDALEQFITKFAHEDLLLLQGSPGIGKSLIARTMLKKQGVDYAVINAGTVGAREQLREAFFTGKTAVIDELNVDPELMNCLNFYLMGERAADDPKDDIVPGFRAIATTNSAKLEGRHLLAPALQNRIQFVYHDDFTPEELELFVSELKEDGKLFVAAFLECMREDSGVNMRVFHRLLKAFIEKGLVEDVLLSETGLDDAPLLQLAQASQNMFETLSTDEETLARLQDYFITLQKNKNITGEETCHMAALLKLQEALERFSGSVRRATEEVSKHFPEGMTGELAEILGNFSPEFYVTRSRGETVVEGRARDYAVEDRLVNPVCGRIV